MVSQYGGGGFGNNWFDQQWHPTGGWVFSSPTGGYVNRYTGEQMSATQFDSRYLNPSYIPNSSDHEWGVVATKESEGYDLPINFYGRLNAELALNDGLGQFISNNRPYFRAFEGAYSIASLGFAVSAIGLQSNWMNTNIHLRIGALPTYWSRYSFLRNTSNKLSYGGYVFAITNLYIDTKAYQANTIGAAEFGFNTMTNFYGVYIGGMIGGPPGVALGFSFDAVVWGSKQFYKNFVQPSLEGIYMRMYNMTHPSIGNWNPYGR